MTSEITEHIHVGKGEHLFTSESVTEGHPDKICDQISDGILDAVLAEDPSGRVACETLVNTGLVVVSGEISTSTYVDVPRIVRRTITEIGYDSGEFGFDGNSCAVMTAIDEQSADIAQGVDKAYEARTDAADDDEFDQRRRRRSGNDVRLRDERDPGADADADPDRPYARPPALRRSARTAPSTTSAPTARPR